MTDAHTTDHIHNYSLAHEPHDGCPGTAPEWPDESVYRIGDDGVARQIAAY